MPQGPRRPSLGQKTVQRPMKFCGSMRCTCGLWIRWHLHIVLYNTYCNVNTCRLPFFLSSSKITWSHDLKSRRIPVDVRPRKVTWNKTYPLGNEKHLVTCQFSGCELVNSHFECGFSRWSQLCFSLLGHSGPHGPWRAFYEAVGEGRLYLSWRKLALRTQHPRVQKRHGFFFWSALSGKRLRCYKICGALLPMRL